MKLPWATVLKVVVSAGLVGFLLWRVDLAELGATLARTDLKLALAAIVVAHADRALQGGKWWLLLRAAGNLCPNCGGDAVQQDVVRVVSITDGRGGFEDLSPAFAGLPSRTPTVPKPVAVERKARKSPSSDGAT